MPKRDMGFLESAPLDEDEELDELEDEDEESSELDPELSSLADTIFGDGDTETKAQALKDFVQACKSKPGDGGY